MKKNTFKRVLAGSLALLTVAAYMPANVGGLIQVKDSLVANAATTVRGILNFEGAQNYLTSIENGTTMSESQIQQTVDGKVYTNSGTTVVMKSSVPLAVTTTAPTTIENRGTYKFTADIEKYEFRADTTGYFVKTANGMEPVSDVPESGTAFVSVTDSSAFNVYVFDGKLYSDKYVTSNENKGTAISSENYVSGDTNFTSLNGAIKTKYLAGAAAATSVDITTETVENKKAEFTVNADTGLTDSTVLKYFLADGYTYTPATGEAAAKLEEGTGENKKSVSIDETIKKLLTANSFSTTDDYINGSKFVVDTATGKTFLAVGIKAIEPTTQPDAYGVYTYTYTAPNIAGVTVTVEAEKETGEVTLYEHYKEKDVVDKVDDIDSGTADSQWKNLKIAYNGNTKTLAEDEATEDAYLGFTNGKATVSDFVQQGAVTITNTEPFVVYVDDNDTSKEEKKVEVTYANGLFTAEFTMPKSADEHKNVAIKIVKQEEKYSYALNSDKTAVIANGTYTKNLEAASMAIKSYDPDDKNYFPATGTDAGVAVGSDKVDYGDTIAIKTVAGRKFITASTLKITKGTDNETVYDSSKSPITNEIAATSSTTDGVTITSFKATSGTYTVSYEVDTDASTATSTKSQSYTITKTFTVDARGKITADNVALKVTVKKNNKYQPLAGIIADDSIPDGTKEKTPIDPPITEESTIPSGKEKYYEYTVQCATGKDVEIILTQAAKETVTTSGYTFFVEPVVTPKGEEALTKDTDFLVGGTTFSAKNAKRTVDVTITNSEYGGSVNSTPISINWSVVDYDAKPIFAEELKDNSAVSVALEDVATLGTEILNAAASNTAAKDLTTKDVTFEYVAGTGADRAKGDDELDSYESGLPTEKGKYTVYMSYGDKIVTTAEVSITSYKVNFVPDAAALSIGYGDDFTVDSYKLVDANGKVMKNVTISDLKVQFMQPKYEKKNGVTAQTGNFEDFGSTTKVVGDSTTQNTGAYKEEVKLSLGFKKTDTTAIDLNAPSKEVLLENFKDKLNAGTYYVKFSATLSNEDDYAFASDVYELTVSKKALSDDSVNILIAPAEYDGKTKQPQESSITAKDADTGFNFVSGGNKMLKLNEGKSAVNVGSYDLEIGLVDSATQNYEGVATVKWCIVNKTTNITTGLKWDDTMTTLYDNGRIHLEINKNAVGRINLPSDVTISEFGVIADNSGKIPAPKFSGTYKYGYDYTSVVGKTNGTTIQKDVYYAEQQLQLGNEGYLNGKYTAKGTTLTDGSKVTANDTVYKTNVKVTGVKTGIWARPYVLLSDGTVAYGPVKYVNLEEEAKEKLNLQMPYDKTKPVVRQANMTDEEKKKASTLVNAGYDPLQNRAYAYTTFTDLSSEGFKGTVLEVSDFGVVVDNKNAIEVAGDYASLDETQKTKVNEKLVIGGNSKLIVGHYQKGNKNLAGDNEYTANIKIYNSETGVWIRPYLDLGNDLIVYGDPIYVQSVSEYFSDGIATLEASVVPNQTATEDMKIQLAFAPSDATTLKAVTDKVTSAYTSAKTGNKAKDAPEVKVVKAGVVLDKKGTLVAEANKAWTNVERKEDVPSTAVKAASTLYPTAKANLILGNGFIEGKKTSGLTNNYIGKVSPAGKDLIVKNYVVYDIGGTEVTVYGAAQAYEYTNKNWNLSKGLTV